jgi:hypothetical protein
MFKTLIIANWRNNSVVGATQPAEHNAFKLRSIGLIVFEIWQNVSNAYSCKWNNCHCSRRSRNLLSTTRRHSSRLAQLVLRYDKMFQTLILANWAILSLIDEAQPAEHNAWTIRSIGPIVFEIWQNVWNTKCLKPYSCKLKKQQCNRQGNVLSTTRWH